MADTHHEEQEEAGGGGSDPRLNQCVAANEDLNAIAAGLSVTMKRLMAASIFYTQFASGCALTILSPTVIRFSQILDVDVATISIIFTVRTIAYIIAALTWGILFNWFNRQICVILLTAVATATLFLLPSVTSLTMFLTLGAVMGIGSAGYDQSQTAWIIEMFRSQAAPYILSQHFAYSLGPVAAPILLAPFLNDDDNPGNGNFTKNNHRAYFILRGSSSTDDDSDLFVPFAIAGGLMALAVLSQLCLFIKIMICPSDQNFSPDSNDDTTPFINGGTIDGVPVPPSSNQQERTSINNGSNGESEGGVVNSSFFQKWRKYILIFLAAVCIGFYSGIELTLMQFLPTYCVYSRLALSEAQGAQILFGLTLTFCMGRLLGILLVILKFPPQFIIYVNCLLILGANVVLNLWGQDSVGYMWAGSLLLGAGISTIYPSIYAFIEKHLHVTNGIVATMTVMAGLVTSVYPVVVGQYVETETLIFNYVIYFSVAILMIVFSILYWTTTRGRVETV